MLLAPNPDGFVDPQDKLPSEVEEGNVEYKVTLRLHKPLRQLRLSDPPPERVEHLGTQLKWRLSETGDCYYYIG